MKYGYARVSTDDQKTDLQIAALRKADCRHIVTDTASGATSKRPELTRCLESLRAGDMLIVWKLDQLGRSLSHLVAVLSELQGRGLPSYRWPKLSLPKARRDVCSATCSRRWRNSSVP